MTRTLRHSSRKTKTTRCSCCEYSNNLSKESSQSLKKKGALAKHSLEARDEEAKKTQTKGTRSNPKFTSATKNQSSITKVKECVVRLTRLKLRGSEHVRETKDSPETGIKNSRCTYDKPSPKLPVKHSVPLKKLRARKPVKYADSSLEVTKCEEKANVKKVPIYNQNTGTEKHSKRKGDQYEFDSDTEIHKKRKRRKVDDSTSDEYNKTIQNILKNISNKKGMTKKKKVIFSDLNRKKKVTKPVLLKQTINNNNHLKSKATEFGSRIKQNVIPTETKNIKNLASNKLRNNFLKKPDVINYINLTSTPKIDVNLLSKNKSAVRKQGLPNFMNISEEKQETDEDNVAHLPDATIDYSDSDEEYFTPSTNKSDKSPKVKILSNIQLQPRRELNLSLASPRMFKYGQPNANSTLHNVLTPWRFNDINIKRNPHFIAIKPSSLPYMNQDMVLDHSIVDKLNETSKAEIENMPQENRKNNTKKSLMQATLNDYLECNSENKENKENTEVSLFDNDQFSPIKSGNRISHKSDVKRRILGELNENTIEDQTSCQNVEESHLNQSVNLGNDEYTNFGFDSTEEEDEKNVFAKEKSDRPFRLSINMHDKKYQRNRKLNTKKVESILRSDEDSSATDDDDDDDSDIECKNGQIKLFEDFNNTQELLERQEEQTGMMKKSRNRKNKDLQKQKKGKDVRSKEEEEQAEKWAAAFNSMCEEIEQFPLEVE